MIRELSQKRIYSMLPISERWARIGRTKKSWLIHVPRAGLCLSAFLIVTNSDNEILLGRPREHEAWPKYGGLPKFHSKELEKEEQFLLPATHLLMEEPPDLAAKRIARQWVGYQHAAPSFKMVQSHLRPSGIWKPSQKFGQGMNHWDICFVYTMGANQTPFRVKPWWREMRFVSPTEILKLKVGRGHKDVLRASGILSRM